MISSLLATALMLLPASNGNLSGVVRMTRLSQADHLKHHTHWDPTESIAGYGLEVYRLPKSNSSTPVKEIGLDKSGKFLVSLQPGLYYVTVEKDMNAGAFVRYPAIRVRVRARHRTTVRLVIRAEYF